MYQPATLPSLSFIQHLMQIKTVHLLLIIFKNFPLILYQKYINWLSVFQTYLFAIYSKITALSSNFYKITLIYSYILSVVLHGKPTDAHVNILPLFFTPNVNSPRIKFSDLSHLLSLPSIPNFPITSCCQ